MDFNRIVLADKLGSAIVVGARRERVCAGDASDPALWRRLRQPYTRALDLLLLFDRIVIPLPNGDDASIPVLEDAGILQFIKVGYGDEEIEPLPTAGNAARPGATNLRRGLAVLTLYRDQVIDVLVAQRFNFATKLAVDLGLTPRALYDELLEFATLVFTAPAGAARHARFARRFSPSVVSHIERTIYTEPPGAPLSNATALLFVALATAGELRVALDLSSRLESVVASDRFRKLTLSAQRLRISDRIVTPEALCILGATVRSEGACFPSPRNISDVLRLRRDPRLAGLRQRVAELTASLHAADPEAIAKCQQSVRLALAMTAKVRTWERYLRWSTYASVPIGIAEAVVGFPPVTSTAVGVLSAVGTAAAQVKAARSEWVLFGSG